MPKFIVYAVSLIIMTLLESFTKQTGAQISYLPLGDSYTICTGATEKESWPYILTRHLNEAKIKTVLLDNPARNGYSTQNLIDYELPLLKKHQPNFVTILIGVNDWVRGVPKNTFQKNLVYILDVTEKAIAAQNGKILLITIPDFGVTPTGKNYSGGRDISKGLEEFNAIIKEEARKRKLEVVDIFEVSKKMKDDKSLVADDGLHPSGKEYAVWEQMILPVAVKLLK